MLLVFDVFVKRQISTDAKTAVEWSWVKTKISEETNANWHI
jgi:hypothetical protein